MLSLIACFAMAQPLQGGTAPSEFAERVQRLDRAWAACPDLVRRTAAAHLLNSFGGTADLAERCRSVDLAVAALEGRAPAPSDAISLRFDPPFAEPKSPANLHISWAYAPRDVRAVRVSVGNSGVVAFPGRELTLTIKPEAAVPELVQSPESGVLIPVTLDNESRTVYLSVVKGMRQRLKTLASSSAPDSRAFGAAISGCLATSGDPEPDLPLIQWLFTGEAIAEGRLAPERLEEAVVPTSTGFCLIGLPRTLRPNAKLAVIFATSTGPTPATDFFNSILSGFALSESKRRGWILVGLDASIDGPGKCIAWLRARLKMRTFPTFILANGVDPGTVSASLKASGLAPAGIALCSPPSGKAESASTYLAYAHSELATLDALRTELGARPGSVAKEYEPGHALLTGSLALPDIFSFFDKIAR